MKLRLLLKSGLVIFISAIFNNTFAQFELRYPDIPTDHINHMIFTSPERGFFVNKGGDIFKTTDAGINWEIVKNIQDHNLNEIKFINSQYGFAYARKNVVYQGDVPLLFTTNGGSNWNPSQVYLFDAVSFLPLNQNLMLKITYSNIKRLDNFYNNWQEVYTIPVFTIGDSTYSYEEQYGNIFQFENLDNENILAIGNSWNAKFYNIISDSVSFILKSKDSGITWDTLWCDLLYEMRSISFVNNQIGWMAGENNTIYKTTDGGITWILQNFDSDGYGIDHIFAINENKVIAAARPNPIISEDGGLTWNSVNLGYYGNFKFHFIDIMNGFAYGDDLLSTTDGGYTWNRVSNSIKDDIVKVDFVNKTLGWALSYSNVYKTINGGYDWESKFTFPQVINASIGIDFIDSNNGWILTHYNIYRSSDGGDTWDSVYLADRILFFGNVHFYNSQLGIIATGWTESVPGSNIYDIPNAFITNDGGKNWQRIAYPVAAEYAGFIKAKFSQPDILWAINSKGLWLSNDTAKTWQQIYSTQYFLGNYSFDFYNSTDGCFSDAGWSINFTTNAGQSWQNFSLSKYLWVNDYKIVGKDIQGSYRIFSVGNTGRFLKYTTGQPSLESYITTYTAQNLNSISVYMENRQPHIWAAGKGFTILYGQTELVLDADKESTSQLDKFSLSQNYPNPFNPLTSIEYRVASREYVILKVYDVLGREVATLVNEEKQPGVYEVEFDAAGLASGIYYYRLKAGSYIQTKKMIYLK